MDKRVFLLPGEAAYSREPAEVSTLLGSCVAVCLYNARLKHGGMNHFMLPERRDGGLQPGKYGDTAITALVDIARQAGARTDDLSAAIFGGGRVIGHLGAAQATQAMDIGDRNIAMARATLKRLRVPVTKEEVGGVTGRRIWMLTATNDIRVRAIQRTMEYEARARKLEDLAERRIRVLIVDDSATVRRILRQGLELAGDVEIVGEAADSYQAREKILELDPDVMCLDIIMPRLDGIAFLSKLMQYKPIPTVIVSTIAKPDSQVRRNAIAAGAVGVIDKEELDIYKDKQKVARMLADAVRNAARTVVRTISPPGANPGTDGRGPG